MNIQKNIQLTFAKSSQVAQCAESTKASNNLKSKLRFNSGYKFYKQHVLCLNQLNLSVTWFSPERWNIICVDDQ